MQTQMKIQVYLKVNLSLSVGSREIITFLEISNFLLSVETESKLT